MIRFEHASKYYGDTAVVEDMTMEINEGEFFILIGPSGSGKTTTLKMINRLIPFKKGRISINGKDIDSYNLQELRWNTGYVLQQIALFPTMTVEENITVVPEMKKWSKEKMSERVTELLELVKLDPEKYRSREIGELSGGEQQRIGVVRALAADPDIILMDEPFSALDPISKNSLQEDIIDLQRKLKKTIVFVTHDMQEAIALGDRICLMNYGKVEQIGTPKEILSEPKNEFVKEFLHTGLPNYQEEQTVQSIISQNLFIPVDSYEGNEVRLSDSVDLVIHYLSKNDTVHVQLEEDRYGQINREHLLEFLSNKRIPSKKETN